MKYLEILVIAIVFAFFIGCQEAKVVEVPLPSAIQQVSPETARAEIDAKNAQFIDVRSPEEFDAEHAAKAVNIPLEKVDIELSSLDRTKPVYVICQTGRRSQIASETLEKNGFTQVFNIQGGTAAWKKAGLPITTK
jgi:rhodanese-related sulfurtransferase